MTPPAPLVFNLDSIFRPRDVVLPVQRTSPFAGHELSVQEGFLEQRVTSTDDLWIFGALVVVTVLLLLFVRTRRVKVGMLFRSCIAQRQLDMLLRASNLSRFPLVLQATLYFALLAAIPGYLLMSKMGETLTAVPVVDYLLMAGVLWLACLLRQAVTLLLGNTFCDGDAIRIYISNTQVFMLADTLILLPLVTLVRFSPFPNVAFTVAMSAMALLMAIRIFRGMHIILSTAKNSKFYLFSYLCIVEIVPLLVVAKLAIG